VTFGVIDAPVDLPPAWLDLEGIGRELGISYRATVETVNSYVTSGFPEGHVLSGYRVRWKLSEVRAWRDAPREPEWKFGDEWPGPEVPARDAEPHEVPRSCASLVRVATEGGWLTRVTYARGTIPTAQGRPGRVIATTALRFRRPAPAPGMHPIQARGYALWREGTGGRWTFEGAALVGVANGVRYYSTGKDGIERCELITTTGINKLNAATLKLVLSRTLNEDLRLTS
jgi:hypothetical protein